MGRKWSASYQCAEMECDVGEAVHQTRAVAHEVVRGDGDDAVRVEPDEVVLREGEGTVVRWGHIGLVRWVRIVIQNAFH